MASKRNNLKDNSGIVDKIIHELSVHGSVRLVHFGLFRVVEIKGHKRYDFKKRRVVEAKPYKQIIYTPARGIREMLRDGKMAAD